MRRLLLGAVLGAALQLGTGPVLAQGNPPATGLQAGSPSGAGVAVSPTVGPRPGVPPPPASGQAPYQPQSSATAIQTPGNTFFDANNSAWAADDTPPP